MTVAGTFPTQGLRVALELSAVGDGEASYVGAAYTPQARHDLQLLVSQETGASRVLVTASVARDDTSSSVPALTDDERGFLRQLGAQLHRRAREDGDWARRVHRWRASR